MTLTGLISETGGAGGIEWCTTGILWLTDANTFTGTLDMRLGTLLSPRNDSAAGSGPIILDTNTVLSSYPTNSVRTLQNAIEFTGSSAQLGNNDDNSLTLNGVLSGGGAVTYAGGPTGHLTLNGANTGFSPSSFTISSGDVIVGNSNAFGSAGSVSLTGGAALTVESGGDCQPSVPYRRLRKCARGQRDDLRDARNRKFLRGDRAKRSSGNGPGDHTFSSGLTIASGSAIHFDIYERGLPRRGPGCSLDISASSLDLTASPSSITFSVSSRRTPRGMQRWRQNFNPSTPYSWMFATSSSLTGFNSGSSQFDLDTSGFANNTFGGTFSVTQGANDLFLNFTPVPEPEPGA